MRNIGKMRDLGNRQLARERHPLDAELRCSFDTGRIMGVHLRRCVHACLGQRAHELEGDTDVLNDERIGSGTVGLTGGFPAHAAPPREAPWC